MNNLELVKTFSRNKMYQPEIFGATYNVFPVPFIMKLGIDIHIDAGDGRCPSAQVLRNSLSGHPPSPATTRRLA